MAELSRCTIWLRETSEVCKPLIQCAKNNLVMEVVQRGCISG